MISRFEPHSHTDFSNFRLLDSINKIENLIDRAIDLGLSGIAITDHETLSAHMRANLYQQKINKNYPNFKVALGNEIYLTENRDKGQKYYHFILIAKDKLGYKMLRRLSSNSWLNCFTDRGVERVPTLKKELHNLIMEFGKGHLIATTACLGGEFSSLISHLCDVEAIDDKSEIYKTKLEINNFLMYCKELFADDFYIEIAPGCSFEQINVNKRIIPIAEAFNISIVVGTDAHYLKKEDRYVHSAYLNSQNGEREVDSFYEYSYLQSNQEIIDNLKVCGFELEFIEKLFVNSENIYNKIENYSLQHKQIIPRVTVKDYEKTLSYFGVNNELKDELDSSLKTIKSLLLSDEIQERYWINECLMSLINKNLFTTDYLYRLEEEANVIKFIGEQLEDCLFAYFNTLKHYINLFWECGSIVGPGRGSSTGYLSNYLLGITQLDPLRWELPEWRFLNRERAELPSL